MLVKEYVLWQKYLNKTLIDEYRGKYWGFWMRIDKGEINKREMKGYMLKEKYYKDNSLDGFLGPRPIWAGVVGPLIRPQKVEQ